MIGRIQVLKIRDERDWYTKDYTPSNEPFCNPNQGEQMIKCAGDVPPRHIFPFQKCKGLKPHDAMYSFKLGVSIPPKPHDPENAPALKTRKGPVTITPPIAGGIKSGRTLQ